MARHTRQSLPEKSCRCPRKHDQNMTRRVPPCLMAPKLGFAVVDRVCIRYGGSCGVLWAFKPKLSS